MPSQYQQAVSPSAQTVAPNVPQPVASTQPSNVAALFSQNALPAATAQVNAVARTDVTAPLPSSVAFKKDGKHCLVLIL